MAKLTERQKRFVDEYIISGVAEDAAIKAGYSVKYARGSAHKLIANVGIKAELDKRMQEVQTNKIAKAEEVLEFLTASMRGEILEPVTVTNEFGGQDIKEVKPNVSTRIRAGELLGKRYQLFTDKVSVDANVQGVLFIDDLED